MNNGFSTQEAKRRQRDYLFTKQRGLCYWCKCQMVKPNAENSARHKPQPDNLATIDHLESRLNPMRGQLPGKFRHVLACKKCNEARSIAEHAQLSIEELRQRSQQHRSNFNAAGEPRAD